MNLKSQPPLRYSPISPQIYSPQKYSFQDASEKFKKSLDFYTPQTKFEFEANDEEVILNKPKIIGQLFNTYILIEASDGLQVIDQHIAHERTVYEKLKETENTASQLLLTSNTVKIEPSQLSLLLENADILAKYGYEYDIVDDKSIVLRKIPQILVNKDPEKIINDVLEALNSSLENIEDEILITTACHAAVKAGEKLSIWQIEELVINWQKCKYQEPVPMAEELVISYLLKK